MKTAALITVHVGSNFGSVLQTIASCYLLEEQGYYPIVVNYIPNRVTNKSEFRRFIKGCNSFRGIARGGSHLINFFINKRIYLGYLKKYSNLSRNLYFKDNFERIVRQYSPDVFITGSDQVWNTQHNEGIDTHYFWVGINGVKIAYASSIGMTALSDVEKKVFKHFLTDYKAISVRESYAVDLLKSIDIASTQVIDPTLMLDSKEWSKYASKRLISKPYILVYLPYNTIDKELVYKTVRKISKTRELEVVTFSWNWDKDVFADTTERFCNPGDFLSLMLNADYIITNSFHGTAFSIGLNKQFYVYMPSKFTSRIESLLKIVALENRVLDKEITSEQMDSIIDYSNVNEILAAERQKAKNYLTESLR